MVPARPADANAPTFASPAYEPLSSPLCNSGDNAPTIGIGVEQGADALDADTQVRDTDSHLVPVLHQAPDSDQRPRPGSVGADRVGARGEPKVEESDGARDRRWQAQVRHERRQGRSRGREIGEELRAEGAELGAETGDIGVQLGQERLDVGGRIGGRGGGRLGRRRRLGGLPGVVGGRRCRGERRSADSRSSRRRRSRTSRPRPGPRTRRRSPRWRRSPGCFDPRSWSRRAAPTLRDWRRSPAEGCWRRKRPRRRPLPLEPGMPSARPARRCCSATPCRAPPRQPRPPKRAPASLVVNSPKSWMRKTLPWSAIRSPTRPRRVAAASSGAEPRPRVDSAGIDLRR